MKAEYPLSMCMWFKKNIVLGSNQKAINYTSSEKKNTKLRWFVIAQIADVDSTADIGIVEMKRLRQKQCQILQPVSSYGVCESLKI